MLDTPQQSSTALAGRTIRCLLFDLGETLWTRRASSEWEQLERSANLRAVELLRSRINPALLPRLDDAALGERLRHDIDIHARAQVQRRTDIEPDVSLAVLEALHDWGFTHLGKDLGDAIYETLRIRIPESRQLFDDTLPTLDELQQRGFLLGVVTNRTHGGQLFLEDLHRMGLDRYFPQDAIAISSDLALRKPHPGMFQHALNALRARPEEAAMVGDSLGADVWGALSLGIFAVWKPKAKARSGARYLQGEIRPDLVIDHLSDLLEAFQKVGTP